MYMLNRIIRSLSAAPRRAIASVLVVTALAASCLAGCTQTVAENGGSVAAGSAVEAPAGSASVTTSANDAEMIEVKVVVDSSAADGSVSFDGAVEVPEGATVLDALKATGLELDVQDSEYGAFVNAINGLGTGDFGDASGWGYDLNGEMVMESADVATVSANDTLTWTYLV